MSLEIKFASKPENPDPRADAILTGFEEKNDPILIDDDGPDPASLGLPVSFDSTSKALAKPERPRGPQDKNRVFNVDAKNECKDYQLHLVSKGRFTRNYWLTRYVFYDY
jgi:hypothetical protein